MAPAGRHDGRTQVVWAPLVATCWIDGGRPQLLLLYIVDEELDREQQPQLTPSQHLVQPFDPPMDPVPVDYFSTLTPVPKDVAPDLGFPTVNRTSSVPVAARG